MLEGSQINLNTKKSNDQNGFLLNFGMGIWSLFGVWCFVFGIFQVPSAHAATLYITPQGGEHQPGSGFVAEVRVAPEGDECINAADVTVAYPANVLRVVDVSVGDSIFTLWVKFPQVNEAEGTISFIGGIPGGYCGRIPGDPGVTNVLAKIAFQIPGFRVGAELADVAEVGFTDASVVMLNDGRGTEAPLTFSGAIFKVVDRGAQLENTWVEEVRADSTPPEPFTVTLVHDPKYFEGKRVIIFFTTDKQTGLDHYEVLEADPSGNIAGTFRPASWKTASSPYALEDQKLHSVITVKAIDNARNEQVFTFTPSGYAPIAPKKQVEIGWWLIGGVGVLVLAGVAITVMRRMRRKK